MKINGILIILFLSIRSLHAQVSDCTIIGKTDNTSEMKFVYLVNLENKSLTVSPIISDEFSFNVKRNKELELANIILASDSLKTFEYFSAKLKNNNIDSRRIALEDMEIRITTSINNAVIIPGKFLGKDSLRTYAEVFEERKMGIYSSTSIAIEDLEIIIITNIREAAVNGGAFNRDIDHMNLAIKANKYEEFFEQHTDSPISLKLLKALVVVNKKKLPFGGVSNLNVKYFYKVLSEQLKNSEEGKELWQKIITD
ncbi:hypothetical protein DU508_11220 [Pedobacter chinensis]|uniref:DUF4369 domain-containing protein n=1 Tax=Pedobacter chinensis TaxID=2282421 RepID=A0A369PZQ4_9SPHI|nr:hypothetical protein [Pedobacter chinensis]RDC56179.1 hypothetical protein DU508_11220 [Pedobacter chinensis]